MIGKTLSHYRIDAKLGAGGMGVVYRARDTKLGRDVAIKILPADFAADEDRLARFQREARLLASLNHSQIAAIYGLGEDSCTHFLVLELAAGEDLSARLQHGPLAIAETLRLGRQITEALEYSHRQGIIHRDLKPSNIKVTTDKKVMILDFGLAKAFEVQGSAADVMQPLTVMTDGTVTGVILGTACYMSPEQAQGKPLDARTDIWSFGCVLYEMLSGQKAFQGETTSDTIAKILRAEPDWTRLPPATPGAVRRLLRRCLATDPARRLHHLADARLEIDEVLDELAGAPAEDLPQATPSPTPSLRGVIRFVIVVGLVATAFLTGRQLGPRGPSQAISTGPATSFLVDRPSAMISVGAESYTTLALTPDGAELIYVAEAGGIRRLYRRARDRFESVPIPGTEGAKGVFLSPDGGQIGLFTHEDIRKTVPDGGPPIPVCSAPLVRGASWGPDGTIIFSPIPEAGLARVSANGGAIEVLTTPDRARGERCHRWPCFLPDGRAILFTIGTSDILRFADARIAVLSLETGEQRIIVDRGSYPLYLRSGHLLYMRAGSLMAVPFDAERLEVTGPAVRVMDDIITNPASGCAQVAVSQAGDLAYLRGDPLIGERNLIWLDRQGDLAPVIEVRRAFGSVRISPDGRFLAVDIDAATGNVWILDNTRGGLTRLTYEWSNTRPVWTPDGRKVIFASDRHSAGNLYWKAVDGSGDVERLTESVYKQWPTSCSADGILAFTEQHSATGEDIWLLELKGERVLKLFLCTPFSESNARFSPCGKWIAYTSDEAGRREVYIQPYPGDGRRWQISTGGGDSPCWSPRSGELYYHCGDELMAVMIDTAPAFRLSKPRSLIKNVIAAADITPDGERFVVIRPQAKKREAPVHVLLGWAGKLEALVSGGVQ